MSYQIEMIHNNSIIKVSIADMHHREEIDRFCDDLLALNWAWELDKPMLQLYDVRQSTQITPSPYLRKRSTDLLHQIPPTIKGRAATLLKTNFLFTILRNFIEHDLNRRSKQIENRIFFTEEQAMQWLCELL
jgi:hypothetical protein